MVADLVNLSTDRVILGLGVSASAAATYEIAARAVLAVRAVAEASVWAMIPTVTAEIALRGRAMIPAFFHRYTRLTIALVLPLFACACVTAPFLFVAWLDQLPEDVVGVVLILSVAFSVNLGSGVAGAIVAADGRVGLSARYMVLGALLNVCATAAAAPLFGYYGVVAATGVAITAATVAFLVHFHRTYGLDPAAFWRAIAPPALLAVGLAAPIALITLLWPVPDDRWHALPPLALTGGLYTAAYWLLASRLRLLPERLSLRRARKAPRSASPAS
jgi:O-antigen/teichoic acid export membrane protein